MPLKRLGTDLIGVRQAIRSPIMEIHEHEMAALHAVSVGDGGLSSSLEELPADQTSVDVDVR